MKRFFVIFLAFAIGLNAAVITSSKTYSATGMGMGSSYEEAVDNALEEAVKKLNGGYLKASTQTKVNSTKSSAGNDFKKDFERKIDQAIRGKFSSFNVLEHYENDGEHKVIVKVFKTTSSKYYKVPGQNTNKRSIIVVPRVNSLITNFANFDEITLLHKIKVKLQNEIYRARKFNLLDRDNGAITSAEESFIKNSGAADEALKLGKSLGADYVLLYDIDEFSYKEGEISQYTNTKTKPSLSARINYQIILLATKAIKYSNTTKITLSPNDFNSSVLENFIEKIAVQISNNFHSAIYPPVVESISNDFLVFTQKIPVGTALECFARGKVITDSQTKEKSYIENFVATAKVVRNNDKQSYATSSSKKIKKGDICKIVDAKPAAKQKVFNSYGVK